MNTSRKLDSQPESHTEATVSAVQDARAQARLEYSHQAPRLGHYRQGIALFGRGSEPTPAQVGAAAACLRDVALRDAVVVLMTNTPVPDVVDASNAPWLEALVNEAMRSILDPADGTKPSDSVEHHRQLLAAIVALLPSEDCAPALTLLALIAWWSDDPGPAHRHLAKARHADPMYRLAHLLDATLACNIHPGWVSTSKPSRT